MTETLFKCKCEKSSCRKLYVTAVFTVKSYTSRCFVGHECTLSLTPMRFKLDLSIAFVTARRPNRTVEFSFRL